MLALKQVVIMVASFCSSFKERLFRSSRILGRRELQGTKFRVQFKVGSGWQLAVGVCLLQTGVSLLMRTKRRARRRLIAPTCAC